MTARQDGLFYWAALDGDLSPADMVMAGVRSLLIDKWIERKVLAALSGFLAGDAASAPRSRSR